MDDGSMLPVDVGWTAFFTFSACCRNVLLSDTQLVLVHQVGVAPEPPPVQGDGQLHHATRLKFINFSHRFGVPHRIDA